MNKSLYDILEMKAKNSIFKSVFPTNNRSFEGYKIVEVEPYDETFLNATSTVKKYDKTVDRIIKKVYKTVGDCWIIFFTDYGQTELMVNDFYMKEWGLL